MCLAQCSFCKKREDEAFITIWKVDTSVKYDLPLGTVIERIRYCEDHQGHALLALAKMRGASPPPPKQPKKSLWCRFLDRFFPDKNKPMSHSDLVGGL